MKGRRLCSVVEVFRPWSSIKGVLVLFKIVSSYRIMLSIGCPGVDHDTERVVLSSRKRVGGSNPSGAVIKENKPMNNECSTQSLIIYLQVQL